MNDPTPEIATQMPKLSKFRLIVLTAVLLPLSNAAHAQENGNISRGHDLASKVCAVCHAIEDGDLMSPNFDATPFETIANTPRHDRVGAVCLVSVTASDDAQPGAQRARDRRHHRLHSQPASVLNDQAIRLFVQSVDIFGQ